MLPVLPVEAILQTCCYTFSVWWMKEKPGVVGSINKAFYEKIQI